MVYFHLAIICLIAITPSGIYINNKFSLCHKPSFAIMVFWNSALSDIINNIKKIMAITNDTIEIKPIVVSDFLNDNMESNRGRTSINQLYT